MSDDSKNDGFDPRLLSGAYSLDAVSSEEAAEFEKAADASPALRKEADDLAETAGHLGLAAEPVQPSDGMKANLMSLIGSTPQLPARESPPAAAESSTAGPAAAGPAETAARGRWFTRPVGILVAAAAAIALFAGGSIVGASLTNGTGSPPVNEASVARLAEISAAGDAQRASTPVAGGGTATLVWSVDLGQSAVIVNDLPALSADQVYEAWYIDESGAVAAGTFTAADSGTTWHVLDGAMTPGDTVGVTIEPKGGSDQPTTDPIFAVESA